MEGGRDRQHAVMELLVEGIQVHQHQAAAAFHGIQVFNNGRRAAATHLKPD